MLQFLSFCGLITKLENCQIYNRKQYLYLAHYAENVVHPFLVHLNEMGDQAEKLDARDDDQEGFRRDKGGNKD